MYYSSDVSAGQLLMDRNQVRATPAQWHSSITKGKSNSHFIFFRKVHRGITLTEMKMYMSKKKKASIEWCP